MEEEDAENTKMLKKEKRRLITYIASAYSWRKKIERKKVQTGDEKKDCIFMEE